MALLKSLRPELASMPSHVRMLSREEAAADWSRARDANNDWRRWYKSPRWRALRLEVLDRDGWICRATHVPLIGLYPAHDSPVVDHIVPHRGDAALFWDPANLQSVSKAFHDAEKQRQERGDAPK